MAAAISLVVATPCFGRCGLLVEMFGANLHRCFGPPRAGGLGLRASVERTAVGNAHFLWHRIAPPKLPLAHRRLTPENTQWPARLRARISPEGDETHV